MADVQPLAGIRYTPTAVENLALVIAPPYDVISPEAQARYYARSPYNIIRLELGQEHATDSTLNNRYTRAAATFAEWRLSGVMRQDHVPCYYLYQQVFTYDNQTYTRTSLLARVRLEPWDARVVLPHEHTLAKAKSDRLHLLRACAANFSPVMSLYNDPQGRLRRLLSSYAANAEARVTDEVGEEHILHPITDAGQIALIQDFFSERQLYIADGHHRYETALNYREEVRETRHGLSYDDPANFVLMSLIDVDDPGMLVLPTHRMLFNLSQEALARLNHAQLSQAFTVRELDNLSEVPTQLLAGSGESAPSFILSTPGQSWFLQVNEQGRARMAQNAHSAAWNELDVAIAHTLILEALLGLTDNDLAAGTNVRYTRDPQAAWKAVQTGEVQAALLLNPTRVRQISAVAEADDRMPQKSTYFYPKLITGLVINPLW